MSSNRYKERRFVKLHRLLGIDKNGLEYSAEPVSRFDNPYFMPINESFKQTISGEK